MVESFLILCPKCESRAIVHVAFQRRLYGAHWLELMRAEKSKAH